VCLVSCWQAFSAAVLLFEPFMVPAVLLAIFLKNLFVQHVKQDLLRAAVTDDADEVTAVSVYAVGLLGLSLYHNV